MANKRLKVRRESIVACMTCPLCTNLLVEATTISLCLHSFCRICIYEKLSDDEFDTCPVCDIKLGSNPVDKLRPDHTLQYMMSKIFPVNKRRVEAAEAPEVMPSVSPPAKRKERSLSSLVVSMPKVSVHTSATGRRTRTGIRKSSFPERPKEDLLEDLVEKPNCSETLNNLDPAKSSIDQISDERVENGHRTKTQYDKNDSQSASAPTNRKRLCPPNQNTTTSAGKSPNSMQVVVRHHHQTVPIWFSLVASEDQEEAARLPQISSGFLRMKDNGMPVSAIQKYIAKKLEILTEEEVQITFQGQPVVPTLELRGLLDLWLKAAPATRRIRTRVGNSAKEYVMVLKYSRKTPPAQTPI